MTGDGKPIDGSATNHGPARGLVAALVILALAVLAFAGWQAALRLPFRFELDFGEGFVWSQVNDLLDDMLYRPISEYPIRLMHYTPLYHAIAALLVKLGVDPLLGGRIVSLASGIGLAAACARLAYLTLPEETPRATRRFAALAAATIIAAMPEVVEWSTLMRVDMLAVALGTLGLAALFAADGSRGALAIAGALFLLALFAKQNAAAPLVAGAGALALARPRAALALGSGVAAAAAVLVVAAEIATRGEFLRHTVLYDAARVSWSHFTLLWLPLAAKSAIVVVIAAGFAIWRLRQVARARSWRTDPSAWKILALAVNLVIGFVLSLAIVKNGAGANYMLPLLAPAAVLAGVALALLPGKRPVLLLAVAVQGIAGLASYPFPDRAALALREQQDAKLLEFVRAATGPVLSEDMTLLMRAARPVPWELGAIAEITALGIFDETPLVKRLEDGWFDTLIVYTWEPERFSPALRAAAQARYVQVAAVGEFEVWRLKPR